MKKILPWLPVTLVLLFLLFMFGLDVAVKHSPAATCLFLVACVMSAAVLFSLIMASVTVSAAGEIIQEAEAVVQAVPERPREDLSDAEALAILGEYLLGKNGEIPDTITFEREAIGWAYGRMQYRHAWVVCGPCENAMERLMKKREKA